MFAFIGRLYRACSFLVILVIIFNATIVYGKSPYEIIINIAVIPKEIIEKSSDSLDKFLDNIQQTDILDVKKTSNVENIENDSVSTNISYDTEVIEQIFDGIIEEHESDIVDEQASKNLTTDYDNNNLNSLISSIETIYKETKPVIIIDAGHGGKDSGTVGYGREKEKKIVLLYARELASAIKRSNKYKVYLTRNRDVFLSLRKRGQIARKFNADLFISIHADAARSKSARGLSIYTLSEKASNKEAALLAQKENREDVIAGLDLSNLEQDVSDTLIDLSLRDAKNKSRIFAKILHKYFVSSKVRVKNKALHSAGFVVLKNPNMASILLEIGYLSNKFDARNLRKRSYRRNLIDSILKAIDKYFMQYQ